MIDPHEALAEVLAAHLDCITNCDIKTDGVRDGQMWYVIHWNCGLTSGPLTLGDKPIQHDHRLHLASVLADHFTEAVTEARAREGSDLPDPDLASSGDGRVIAAAINALTTELRRARADSLAPEAPSEDER